MFFPKNIWRIESFKQQFFLFEMEIFCKIINNLLSLLNNLKCPY